MLFKKTKPVSPATPFPVPAERLLAVYDQGHWVAADDPRVLDFAGALKAIRERRPEADPLEIAEYLLGAHEVLKNHGEAYLTLWEIAQLFVEQESASAATELTLGESAGLFVKLRAPDWQPERSRPE
jgi:hypothetical protein